MSEANTSNDNVIFAVSFLAVLVTASSYREYLTKISITLFSYNFSVFDLLIVMAFVLFCSVYFSAIDKLRYSNFTLISIKSLKHAILFADFFYIISILLLPLLFFLFLSCSYINYCLIQPLLAYFNFGFFNKIDINTLLSMFISVLSLLLVASTYYITKNKNKMEVKISILESWDHSAKSLKIAGNALDNRDYSEMIIQLYDCIINILYAKLAEKRNLKRNLLDPNSLIKMAKIAGLINKDQINLIYEIRTLRDGVAHGLLENPLDDESAKELRLKTADLISILYNIEPN